MPDPDNTGVGRQEDHMNFFVAFDESGGSYYLTKAGTVSIIILSLAILFTIGFVSTDTTKKKTYSAKQLTFTALAIALSFVLSYVKIFHMPWGGSVTACSMLFVSLIGYWYGLKAGLIAGFIYGCLQFIQGGGSYILDPLQACLDYFFAFTALGLTGLFRKLKRLPFEIGYSFAVIARGAFHALGGYFYWMDYMPENFPASLKAVYPIAYNYAYLIPEAVLTLVVISLPPVRKALSKVKELALDI